MHDWDDLRYFLAVARHGSFSAGARALDVAQPTIGRRIRAFEKKLGTKLFDRSGAAPTLTGAGVDVLAYAERMEREATAVLRVASGRDAGITGSVRVTTTKWFASAVVAPMLAVLSQRYPGLALELHGTSSWSNLTKRDADVALRFTRFEQADVVQRRVARVGFGLYAAESYLASRGLPDFARGCPGHALVTMSSVVTTASDRAYLESVAHAAVVAFRSNAREAQASAAAAGAGMVCLPHHLAARTPSLRLLRPPIAPPERAVWLGVHRDNRALARIRAVTETLSNGLAAVQRALRHGS